MEVRVRESCQEDFAQLWRIDQECFAPGISYSQAELLHYMTRPGAFTLVAEASTQAAAGARTPSSGGERPGILGFVVGQRQRRGVGHIVTIDVIPEARRLGVGTVLMTAAEGRLRAGGCSSIFLETAVDNDSALKFYKRQGYYVLKTIPRYYLDKIDALLLAKSL